MYQNQQQQQGYRRGGYYNDRYDRDYQHRGGYRRHNNYNNQQHKRAKPPQSKPKVVIDMNDDQWKEKLTLPKADVRIRTTDVTDTKGADFEDWSLSRALLMGIFELGFEKPSPVQEQSIPSVLMGSSLLARAKNGTGKTGAFAIPCLEKCDEDVAHTQMLVLLPTRELALQTSHVFKQLSKYLNLEIVVSTGGTNLKDDIIRLQAIVHVIIGTPGRLQDLNKQGVLKLAECRLIVLDEADKLLTPDFLPAVENLLQATPADRQLMLFSATFPGTIAEFKETWLPGAEIINLMDSLTLQGITQHYAFVDESEKVHCLYALIRKLHINQCIIFCNSVNRVELLSRKISRLGFPCFYIHGQMGQKHRNRVFQGFRSNQCRYLVCTDIFTRGIDIKSLNVVINFDFPRSSNTYLHRIGRSGRFGNLGLSVNFITNEDRYNLCKIETELNTQVQPVPAEIDSKLYN